MNIFIVELIKMISYALVQYGGELIQKDNNTK